MGYNTRLAKSFEGALVLPLKQASKYVLFSDCHRGTGRGNDNFLKNEYLYQAALKHYFKSGFNYLELGDGDELWENRSIQSIKDTHMQSFELLSKYYAQNRLYAIYGNHDMVKKKPAFAKKYFHTYYCDHTLCERALCPAITFYPAIILEDAYKKKDIYLTHGHQADIFNSTFWRLSRFLVRYIWRPLESIGVLDPTSAAKNHTRKRRAERILSAWAKEHNHILIAGHTHYPMVGTKDSPYFNSGSCVHPAGITAIEIENRCITLVKWSMGTRSNLSLYVMREILGETVCIDEYGPL